ncbi:MAG: hypothetical protein K2I81_03045 [Alphaproteobacteria bacterium]|nr:hypothetical protein [Alphaproteobacteria bacterium]
MTIKESDIKQLAELTSQIESVQSPTPIEGADQKKLAGRYFMQYFIPKSMEDIEKITSILKKYNLPMDTHKSSLFPHPIIRVPESQSTEITEAIYKYECARLAELQVSLQESDLSPLADETIKKLWVDMILKPPYAMYYPKGKKEAAEAMALFERFDKGSYYASLTQTKDNRPVIVMSLNKNERNPMPHLFKNIVEAKQHAAQLKKQKLAKGKVQVEQKGFRAMWQKMQNWFGKDKQK